MKNRTIFSVVAVLVVLTGCSGKTCPYEGGVKCTPMASAYDRIIGKSAGVGSPGSEVPTKVKKKTKNSESLAPSSSEDIINSAVIPSHLAEDIKYAPMMLPPDVMLMEVRPYVGADGHLYAPGFVYLRMSEGKWIVGQEIPDAESGMAGYNFSSIKESLSTTDTGEGDAAKKPTTSFYPKADGSGGTTVSIPNTYLQQLEEGAKQPAKTE